MSLKTVLVLQVDDVRRIPAAARERAAGLATPKSAGRSMAWVDEEYSSPWFSIIGKTPACHLNAGAGRGLAQPERAGNRNGGEASLVLSLTQPNLLPM